VFRCQGVLLVIEVEFCLKASEQFLSTPLR